MLCDSIHGTLEMDDGCRVCGKGWGKQMHMQLQKSKKRDPYYKIVLPCDCIHVNNSANRICEGLKDTSALWRDQEWATECKSSNTKLSAA
jgi:hypothetical protein